MKPAVATLSVDRVPVLDGVAAFPAEDAGGWRGRFALPAGAFLDPGLTYKFRTADGRWGDVRPTGPVPEEAAATKSVTYVGTGPLTAFD